MGSMSLRRSSGATNTIRRMKDLVLRPEQLEKAGFARLASDKAFSSIFLAIIFAFQVNCEFRDGRIGIGFTGINRLDGKLDPWRFHDTGQRNSLSPHRILEDEFVFYSASRLYQ